MPRRDQIPPVDLDLSSFQYDTRNNLLAAPNDSPMANARTEWFHADGDEGLDDDSPHDMHSPGTKDVSPSIETDQDELTDLSDATLEMEEEMCRLEDEFLEVYEADLAEAKLNSLGE
jgi:hypothetical protein